MENNEQMLHALISFLSHTNKCIKEIEENKKMMIEQRDILKKWVEFLAKETNTKLGDIL